MYIAEISTLKTMDNNFDFNAAFLSNSSYGMIVAENGIVIRCNHRVFEMLGTSSSELVGKPLFINIESHNTKDDDASSFEWEWKSANGEYYYFNVEVSTLISDEKSVQLIVLQDVTDKIKMRELLKSRVTLLEGTVSDNLNDILRKSLDELEDLTKSKIGFFHFVEPDQEAISLQAWSTNTLKYCKFGLYSGHYNINEAGVWVEAIRKRKPIIHNDYEDLAEKNGLPEGHSQLVRELVVPVFRKGIIVAVVGVGNKESIYTDVDVDVVAQFSDLAWDIVERKIVLNDLAEYVEKLERSETNFKSFFNNSVVILFVYSKEGNVILANNEACNLLGYPCEEFQKLNVFDIHPPELEDQTRENFKEILNGTRTVCSIPLFSKSGAVIPVETNIGKGNWNGQTAYFCVSNNLTELKQSEEKFFSAFNRSGVAMAIISTDTQNYIEINKKFEENTGYSREEIVGDAAASDIVIFEADIKRYFNENILKGEDIIDKVIRYNKKNGDKAYAILNISFLNPLSQKYFLISAINITTQVEAEKQLTKSKENFESFFDNSINILFVFDENSNILEANKEAQSVLGYSRDEFKMLDVVNLHPAEFKEKTIQALENIRKGEQYFCTIPLLTKSGKHIPAETTVGKGVWDGREAYYCVSKNLSELHISEEKFAKAFQHNTNVMIIASLDNFKVIEVNDRFTDVFEFEPHDVIGMPSLGLNIKISDVQNRKLIKTGSLGVDEFIRYPVKTKSGKLRYLNISFTKVDFIGEDYLLVSAQDITKQTKAEIALENNEVRLREITENMLEGIILADLDFNYVFVNKMSSELLGYSKKELLRMRIGEMFADGNDIQLALSMKVVGDTVSKRYVEMVRKDGQHIFVDVSAKRIKIGDEEFILGLQKDATAQYHIEKELLEAYDEISKLKNKLEEENFFLKEEIKKTKKFHDIITQNITFNKVLEQIEIVAPTNASVLIHGETGTGKELVVNAIHRYSNRAKNILIKLNCAAIPEPLIESELFGHEKGAFTGALQQKPGRFEMAHGGTLFLDEIGEMPISLQSKLLRVIQEGEFERVGGVKTIKVDVRIISASNRNLLKEISKGNFRQDLYYRLNVVPIEVPPLRERIDDISLLTNYFVNQFNCKFGKNITKIPGPLMNKLINYKWPGNVRELENLLERAVLMSKGSVLKLHDWDAKGELVDIEQITFHSFEEMQKKYISEVLEHTNWRISGDDGASAILKMKRSTLTSKMQKLGISKDQ